MAFWLPPAALSLGSQHQRDALLDCGPSMATAHLPPHALSAISKSQDTGPLPFSPLASPGSIQQTGERRQQQ